MRCEILTDFSQLQRLSAEWRAWVKRDTKADAFQSWEWADAYWEGYGHDLSVWSPVVYEGRQPIAVLPLVRRRGHVAFLSSPWSDYNDILCGDDCSPAVLETALAAMLEESSDWTVCRFDCLPSDCKILRCMQAMPQEFKKHLQLLHGSLSPTILLNDDGRAGLLRKLANKNQLKRYYNKLTKLGRVTFRHLETREEARRHLENLFHQHITRWAMAGIKSEFLSAEHRAFYSAMVDRLNPRSELRFGVLELNATPIAYHFGFQINGKLTWYKPSFDINYSDFCPGGVLLRALFEYAEEARLTELDFSRGAEPYKYRYCNYVKETHTLYIDRRPGHVISRARQVERRARESVRKRPSLAQAIRRIPARLRVWHSAVQGIDLKKALLSAYRELIWRHTEAAVFCRPVSHEDEPASVRVMGESLNALAAVLIESPELLPQARLREARKRLKAGDRMLALLGPGQQRPMIVWVANRRELSLPIAGGGWTLNIPANAWVIYDIWLAHGRSHTYVTPDILRVVIRQSRGAEHWIVCSDVLPVPRFAVDRSGFQLRKCVSDRALFHWIRRTQVSDPDSYAERWLEASHESV